MKNALNHIFGSMKFIQRIFFTFWLLQNWLLLSFRLLSYAWCNIYMFDATYTCCMHHIHAVCIYTIHWISWFIWMSQLLSAFSFEVKRSWNFVFNVISRAISISIKYLKSHYVIAYWKGRGLLRLIGAIYCNWTKFFRHSFSQWWWRFLVSKEGNIEN